MRVVVLACLAAMVPPLAACGRFGFAEQDPANTPGDDASVQPDSFVEPVSGFTCGEPQRFSSGGAAVAAMTATATTGGQAVFIADTAGNLAVWTYQNAGGTLTPTAAGVVIDSDITTTISAAAVGDTIVVSAIHGLAMPAGTKVYPRDAMGASRGPAVQYTEFGADRAIATSPTGQLAFANIDATSNALQVRKLDTLGASAGAPVTVAPGSDLPSYATLARGGPGYLVQWNDNTDALELALVDASFTIKHGPVQANGQTTEYPIEPKVAWAKTSDAYLVAWHEKNGADDDVWFRIHGSDLAPVTLGGVLGTSGCCAEVVSDGTDFWVAWLDFTTNKLLAAKISATGVVTPRPVTDSGGNPVNGVMLVNGSQPVLVWVETNGSGPEMWMDPLCP